MLPRWRNNVICLANVHDVPSFRRVFPLLDILGMHDVNDRILLKILSGMLFHHQSAGMDCFNWLSIMECSVSSSSSPGHAGICTMYVLRDDVVGILILRILAALLPWHP